MNRQLILLLIGLVLAITSAGSLTSVKAQDVPYRISDKEVEQIMHRLKKDSDKFRGSLDSALDRSTLDGTNREDDINAFVSDFEKETSRLYDRFRDHKSVASDVQTVLERAARIEGFMHRHQFRSDKASRDWNSVRIDLDDLAHAYNVSWNW